MRTTQQSPRDQPPALRRSTGIVLVVAGAILWLAVHVRIAFIATQPAGLVLLLTGLLWLWIPVPAKGVRLRRRLNQLMGYLEWDPVPPGDTRCSLDDLLSFRRQTDAAESAPQPDQQRCP
jgi:uncharacterized protein YjeT (DUF2065 family)